MKRRLGVGITAIKNNSTTMTQKVNNKNRR